MTGESDPFRSFHPVVQDWFRRRFGEPTDIQTRAWPHIADGESVLITAPTGSGKTLTAFLSSLNRLLSGEWPVGSTQVLYVSPLKALNNDVQRNLLTPLDELRAAFRASGIEPPEIHVLTRSGDTPQRDRRRMLRHPPEILITTPESLNLMLSSLRARGILSSVQCVVLDEIHAVAGTKRGTHLITAVERLVLAAGEFQRVAVSATVRPVRRVAEFVAGYRHVGGEAYERRSITVIESPTKKDVSVTVKFCGAPPNKANTRSGGREGGAAPRAAAGNAGADLPAPPGQAGQPGPPDTPGPARPPGAAAPRGGAENAGADLPAPPGAGGGRSDEGLWAALTAEFRALISAHTATLFFVNTRRHAEKISLFLNEGLEKPIAYAHHGSLAKEIRRLVEQKLKEGDLAAIVATSSLELGIDIGDLDLVVMVGSPNSVASGLQRLGRSGHRVGETSRGLVYPLHGRDIVDSAVMSRAILDGDIEETVPVMAPLDVLAQVILAMTGVDVWDIDELFAFLRTAYPYHRLSRRQFDLVLQMLAGRYADTRLRELKPRVYLDRYENTVKGAKGSLSLIYLSGGTIPDRGYYGLKRAGTQGTIGELDEEFVWERSLGDTFTLGAQTWTITAIGDRDVEVAPAGNPINIIPFWRAEAVNRDFHYCERILRALEEWNELLSADPASTKRGLPDGLSVGGGSAQGEAAEGESADNGSPSERSGDTPEPRGTEVLQTLLKGRYNLDDSAVSPLISFLERQREITGCDLPHRHHLLIEWYADPLDKHGTAQLLIHTLWGGRINRPLALLLQAAWEEEYGYAVETFADNDTILLLLPNETDEALVEAMLRNPGLGNEIRIHTLLRRKLESSGLFGGRFRENAGRALLLPRAGFKQRMPLWLTRLRSKKLLAAVSGYQDFPIVVETWRTCLNDEFDLPRLADLLAEVQTGRIRIDWTRTTVPSPFTRGLIWQKTNKYMYQGDEPRASGPSQMGQDLLKEVLHSSRLRPRVSPELVRTVEAKLLRTFPGYAPSSADDLVQFVSDRKVVPSDEWSQLVNAIQRDYADNGIIEGTAGRLAWISLPGSREPAVATLDSTPAMWATVTGLSPGPEERRFWDWASDNVQPISASKDEVSRGRLTGALGALSKSTRVSAGPPEESDGEVEDTDETDGRAEADNVTGSPTSADLGLAGLLAGYLAFSGPVLPERLSRIFGVPEARLDGELAALEQNGDIIIDALLKDDESIYVCDAGNLELLLRLTRAEARPEFTPLSLEHLQTYLAGNQGLIRQGSQPQDMEENLERLFGFPLPVELWESDVFPARMSVYYKAWLDSLLANSELIWLGCGEKTLAFVLQEERRLFTEANGDSDLFPQPRGSYSLWDLKETSELTTAQLTERLWHEAWAGRCTTDSFEPLRRGIAGEFASESPDTARGEKSDRDDYSLGSSTGYRGVSQADRGGRRPRGRSRSRSRSWKAARALSGRWIPLASETEEEDLVYQEEENKDRIRQLLDRYGIVFRELLSGELPALRWAALFRTLRLMELSGEVLAGQFFESIRGLQFVRPEGLERLRLGFTTDAVYWMNACDPASLCGRGLSDLPWDLPSRIPSNYLVFRGAELVVVAGRRGRDLTIHTGPDDPRMDEYLGFFRALASRDFEPASWIAVESVNGKPTRDSEYADALVAFGFVRDYKAFHLRPAFARR